MTTHIKKITARTADIPREPGHNFVVIGRIMRASVLESQLGPYVKFGGSFIAVNEQTGEEFSSAAFITPGIAEDLLMSALQSAQEDDQRATIDFAMRFMTVKDEKSAIGYIWKAEYLHKPSIDDPTARLMAQIKDKIRLPKPDKKA